MKHAQRAAAGRLHGVTRGESIAVACRKAHDPAKGNTPACSKRGSNASGRRDSSANCGDSTSSGLVPPSRLSGQVRVFHVPIPGGAGCRIALMLRGQCPTGVGAELYVGRCALHQSAIPRSPRSELRVGTRACALSRSAAPALPDRFAHHRGHPPGNCCTGTCLCMAACCCTCCHLDNPTPGPAFPAHCPISFRYSSIPPHIHVPHALHTEGQ
jgi:hypothetical protein